MPDLNINVLLTFAAYAVITGLLNLLLSERSRVDAWAEAHPKVAALLKLLRGLGLDPWHLIAAALLFFKGKLPSPKPPKDDKDPPDDGDATVRIIPPPTPFFPPDRSRLHNDSPDEPAEMRGFRYPALPVFGGLLLLLCTLSCSSWKPVARTTNDVARVLCGEFFGQKQGIDVEEAAKKFCETRDDLAPWLDAILAAKREAAPKAAALHP